MRKGSYLWLATIRIENSHGIVSPINAWHRKDHSISTNSEVATTQFHSLFRSDSRIRRVPIGPIVQKSQSVRKLMVKIKLNKILKF